VNIRIRLLTYFFVLAAVPLLMACIIVVRLGVTVQQRQAVELQHGIASQMALRIQDYFQGLAGEMELASRMAGLQALDLGGQEKALGALLQFTRDSFEELSLLDAQGQEVIRVALSRSYGSRDLRQCAASEVFRLPKANGLVYYGPVRLSPVLNEPLLTMARVLTDAEGKRWGVLAAEVRLKPLWRLVEGAISGQPRDSGDVYVLDGTNRVVAHRNAAMVMGEVRFEPPPDGGVSRGLSNDWVVLGRQTISLGNQTLTVVAERPLAMAMGLAVSTVRGLLVLLFVSLLAAGLLAYFLIRRIMKPLQKLTATVRAVQEGALSIRAEAPRADNGRPAGKNRGVDPHAGESASERTALSRYL